MLVIVARAATYLCKSFLHHRFEFLLHLTKYVYRLARKIQISIVETAALKLCPVRRT